MPERNNEPPAKTPEGGAPLFSLLRQYLTLLTGRDPVEETNKTRKTRRMSRAQGKKVYMKKMRVRMEKPAKKGSVPDAGFVTTDVTEAAIAPEMEKSLQQYISRRQAALSRYATKTRKLEAPRQTGPEVVSMNTQAREDLPPVPENGAPAASWKRFLDYMPFMSQAVMDTAERTEKLEKQLKKNEIDTKDMARRLKETELALEKKVPDLKKTTGTPVIKKVDEALLRKDLGNLRSAEKPEAPRSEEVITKDSMGGLQRVKKEGTFGLTQKHKGGFFSRLFGGARDVAADFQEVKQEAREAAQAPAAPAPKIALSPKEPTKLRGGSMLRKDLSGGAAENAPVEKEADIREKEVPAAPTDTSALTSLMSNFEGKKEAPKPGAAVKAAPVDHKEENAIRKKKLETDEKRAEYQMMTKPHIQHREAGFFTQLFASMQYFGMGKERLAIVQNLGTMLNAGLPLIDAIKTLQLETRNRSTKKLLAKINAAVDNGSPLWRAMDDQHFFSPHAIALIRIGEEAGDLAQNMQYLAEQQEKDQGLREKVKMAMIYPIIVMVLMFIVVMGLGLFVLPQLVQVLFNLNVKLPLITRLVIAFSNGFSQHGLVVVPGILLGAAVIAVLGKFTRFKVVVQWVTFHIPGIGKLARQATLARFGVILGGLLEAGVPLVEALRSLVEVTPIVSYKRFYRRLLEHVTIGDSFAKSFAVISSTNSCFPISMQQLIITGERTGSLSKIMLKVAAIYEKEANNTAQRLPIILEPMLLLFIGGLVGSIAFAIIIPIYSVVGNISH